MHRQSIGAFAPNDSRQRRRFPTGPRATQADVAKLPTGQADHRAPRIAQLFDPAPAHYFPQLAAELRQLWPRPQEREWAQEPAARPLAAPLRCNARIAISIRRQPSPLPGFVCSPRPDSNPSILFAAAATTGIDPA